MQAPPNGPMHPKRVFVAYLAGIADATSIITNPLNFEATSTGLRGPVLLIVQGRHAHIVDIVIGDTPGGFIPPGQCNMRYLEEGVSYLADKALFT